MAKYDKSEELDVVGEPTEAEEDSVFVNYDIATYPSDFTLAGIAKMWDEGDIVIPDFQREFVWTIKQSALLIESFLLGLPVPPVFFYVDEANKSLVIDGQQRILSTVFFFEGYFGKESLQGKRQVFRLQGLGDGSPYQGKRFEDLEESDQRKLKNTVLRAINIRQLNPTNDNTSIYHIFERLNTGGTPLKPQEIRNCVFRGPIVNMLKDLNQDPNWRLILGKKTLDKHQKDVELVLRLLALSLPDESYEKPMKHFLNKIMDKNAKASSPPIIKFQKAFPRIAKILVDALGEKPFHLRGPLNSSALDSVFATLIQNETRIPSDLKERFDELTAGYEFEEMTTVSTQDTSVLRSRFALVKHTLLG